MDYNNCPNKSDKTNLKFIFFFKERAFGKKENGDVNDKSVVEENDILNKMLADFPSIPLR